MPALWVELEFDPAELERNVNRASFDKAMERSYTITSKSVRDREWRNLQKTVFSHPSPYFSDVVVIDIPALKLQPYMQSVIKRAHTQHTHDATIGDISNTVEARLR